MSVRRGEVRRSILWTGVESVGLCAISLGTLLVYAHFLTPAELGVAAMALAIVQLLTVPVEGLFEPAIVQRRHISRVHLDTAFCGSVMAGLVLALLCWFAAGPVATLIGEPALAPVLQWMGLSLPFLGVSAPLIGWQRRALDFRPITVRSLIGRLLGGAVGIGFAASGAGAWSLVAQHLASVVIAGALILVLAEVRPRLRFDWRAGRALLRFGVFPVGFGLLKLSGPRVFILLVGAFMGSQTAGYLNLAFRVVDVLRDIIGHAVQQLLLPVFSRLQSDAVAMSAAARRSIPVACAVMFPIFGGLAVCAYELVLVAFGGDWLPAAPIIAVMAVLTFHYVPMMFVAPMMNAVGRPVLSLPGEAVQLLVVIAGMLLFGYGGLAVALVVWAARLIVSTPVDLMMLRRATGLAFHAHLGGTLRVALATLAMIGGLLGLRAALLDALDPVVLLALMVSSGGAAYVLLLWLFDRKLVGGVLAFMGLPGGAAMRAPRPEN